jgi:hypothetical protein
MKWNIDRMKKSLVKINDINRLQPGLKALKRIYCPYCYNIYDNGPFNKVYLQKLKCPHCLKEFNCYMYIEVLFKTECEECDYKKIKKNLYKCKQCGSMIMQDNKNK